MRISTPEDVTERLVTQDFIRRGEPRQGGFFGFDSAALPVQENAPHARPGASARRAEEMIWRRQHFRNVHYEIGATRTLKFIFAHSPLSLLATIASCSQRPLWREKKFVMDAAEHVCSRRMERFKSWQSTFGFEFIAEHLSETAPQHNGDSLEQKLRADASQRGPTTSSVSTA
jgi:hypothetical protein